MYTIKLPAKNQIEIKNNPVSVPMNIEENAIKNPFIIPGNQKNEY